MNEALEKLQARARLAAAGVLIDRLLHDLKQPLNLIRVVAQDLRLDVKKNRFMIGSLPESMDEIEKTVDQLVLRIDRLQVFAKSKGLESSKEVVDLNEACRAVIRRILRAHPHIEISETLAPDLPPVAADPFNMEHALWELLDNALRAAEDAARHRPRIEISTARRAHEIVVAVRDNGCGVPEKERPRIFEPFFTTRREAAGLGLTLALALVTEVDGRIALAESDGAGSLFEILLPGRA